MAQTRMMHGLQAVGGNAALALLLTVVSNLAGIFTMPFVLCWLLGAGRASLTLSPGPLLANLMRAILAPLLLGATVRGIVPGPSPPPPLSILHLQSFGWMLLPALERHLKLIQTGQAAVS